MHCRKSSVDHQVNSRIVVKLRSVNHQVRRRIVVRLQHQVEVLSHHTNEGVMIADKRRKETTVITAVITSVGMQSTLREAVEKVIWETGDGYLEGTGCNHATKIPKSPYVITYM